MYSFFIHALASGGSADVVTLVATIHEYFANMPNITWMIMVDFNREPASLLSGLDTQVTRHIRVVTPILLPILVLGVIFVL